MTLYAFLAVFFVLWALAMLYANWRNGRQFEENQKELERLHQRVEELKQEFEKLKKSSKEFRGLRLVESDEEETTN